MGIEDKAKLDEIYEAKRERLNLLLKQQAIMGFRVDPAVTIEIDLLRRELGLYGTAAAQPEVVEAAEQIGAGGRHVVIEQRFDQLERRNNERLDRFEAQMDRYITRIEKAWTDRLDRVEEAMDEKFDAMEDARKTATRWWKRLFSINSLGLIVALVMVILIIAGVFNR